MMILVLELGDCCLLFLCRIGTMYDATGRYLDLLSQNGSIRLFML